MNPNLGRQFGAFDTPKSSGRGGSYPVYSKGPNKGETNTTGARLRMAKTSSFIPKNEDGMSVIAHDVRSDGRPAAWQSRAESN